MTNQWSTIRCQPLCWLGSKDTWSSRLLKDLPRFEELLGRWLWAGISHLLCRATKSRWFGASLHHQGKEFIGDDHVALILRDNIFHGEQLNQDVATGRSEKKKGATVFGYQVKDPERFGVVEFDADMNAISIEEKPEHPNRTLQWQDFASMTMMW